MAATQEPEYEKFEGDELDDTLLNPAAALFSSNYGVWGPLAAQNMGSWAKQGKIYPLLPEEMVAFASS